MLQRWPKPRPLLRKIVWKMAVVARRIVGN